jgi:hypothetical protein
LDGVKDLYVNTMTGLTRVTYDETKTGYQEFTEALARKGYRRVDPPKYED